MWIARKKLKDLLKRVEGLYDQAAASGDKAIMTGFPGTASAADDCFRELLWAHLDLRQKLAGLSGTLEAMVMRWI
jgi:hypothetical protein